jgi:hypothetical protein
MLSFPVIYLGGLARRCRQLAEPSGHGAEENDPGRRLKSHDFSSRAKKRAAYILKIAPGNITLRGVPVTMDVFFGRTNHPIPGDLTIT